LKTVCKLRGFGVAAKSVKREEGRRNREQGRRNTEQGTRNKEQGTDEGAETSSFDIIVVRIRYAST
jgi:hypothetical protein